MPGGQPKKVLNERQLFQLAKIGCTHDEIAAVMDCGVTTLKRPEYSALIEKGHQDLRKSLRRKQVAVAMKGNVAMLIWLGKNYLEQTDRQSVETTGQREIVLQWATPAVEGVITDAASSTDAGVELVN